MVRDTVHARDPVRDPCAAACAIMCAIPSWLLSAMYYATLCATSCAILCTIRVRNPVRDSFLAVVCCVLRDPGCAILSLLDSVRNICTVVRPVGVI